MISRNTIQRFLQNDEEATAAVYMEYRNLAYFVIATYVGSPDDCNDVLSDTFLKVLTNRSQLKDPSKLRQFITAIAKNEAINFVKKSKPVLDSLYIDEIYGEEDKGNSVLDALEPLLSNKEAIVVYYKAVFDLTWDELSEQTGIPVSTARLIYAKAKSKLREKLGK